LSGIWTPRNIADAEIAWAAELMGLGADAFKPIDGNSSRLDAIRNMDTADFEACPGSGKTTLLVAKLAILANRWSHPRQGICVLSHTNAARNEIGSRLGASPTGIALLRYPHFIGTIHSFVNEFLAIPWLRSKGNPIRVIDDQITLKQRMASLAWNWRQAIKSRPGMSEYALAYDRPDYMHRTTMRRAHAASLVPTPSLSSWHAHDSKWAAFTTSIHSSTRRLQASCFWRIWPAPTYRRWGADHRIEESLNFSRDFRSELGTSTSSTSSSSAGVNLTAALGMPKHVHWWSQ
jgi:AAA domain